MATVKDVILAVPKFNFVRVVSPNVSTCKEVIHTLSRFTKVGIVSYKREIAKMYCSPYPSLSSNEGDREVEGSEDKGENRVPIGNFEDAFKALATDSFDGSVMVFTDCSESDEKEMHLYMLINLWNYYYNKKPVPRLVFIYRSLDVTFSKNENVFYFERENEHDIYLDKDFNGMYEKEMLITLIGNISNIEGYTNKILVIVPSDDYFSRSSLSLSPELQEKIVFITEELAYASYPYPYEISAVIDLCLRKIVYSSIGGGIRIVDDIVGKKYLSDMECISSTLGCPLYRLINANAYNTIALHSRPFVMKYAHLLHEYGIEPTVFFKEPSEIFYDVKKVKGGHREYFGCLSMQLVTNDDNVSTAIFASFIDCLDHNFLDYGQSVPSEELFFQYFEKFRGADTLEIYMNLWNDYVESNLTFEEWAFEEGNHLNGNRLMEVFNIMTAVFASKFKTKIPRVRLNERDLKHMRELLSSYNHHLHLVEERLHVYQFKEGILYKNLLFKNLSNTHIVPIINLDGKILTFAISEHKVEKEKEVCN